MLCYRYSCPAQQCRTGSGDRVRGREGAGGKSDGGITGDDDDEDDNKRGTDVGQEVYFCRAPADRHIRGPLTSPPGGLRRCASVAAQPPPTITGRNTAKERCGNWDKVRAICYDVRSMNGSRRGPMMYTVANRHYCTTWYTGRDHRARCLSHIPSYIRLHKSNGAALCTACSVRR